VAWWDGVWTGSVRYTTVAEQAYLQNVSRNRSVLVRCRASVRNRLSMASAWLTRGGGRARKKLVWVIEEPGADEM
jgi:hypothetical protein